MNDFNKNRIRISKNGIEAEGPWGIVAASILAVILVMILV